jgi:hypothetical protein
MFFRIDREGKKGNSLAPPFDAGWASADSNCDAPV